MTNTDALRALLAAANNAPPRSAAAFLTAARLARAAVNALPALLDELDDSRIRVASLREKRDVLCAELDAARARIAELEEASRELIAGFLIAAGEAMLDYSRKEAQHD